MNNVFAQILKYGGLVVAGLSAVYGGLPVMTQVLLIVMVADVISGALRSIVQKRMSSQVAWEGLAKKATTLVIVALCHYLDTAVVLPVQIGVMTSGFYVYQEALSILENTAAIGLPIPQFLKDALAQLQSGQDRRKAKIVISDEKR